MNDAVFRGCLALVSGLLSAIGLYYELRRLDYG
jgi:hypothetical protein